jgi:hypothetical protein
MKWYQAICPNVHLSFRLSTCISAAPSGQISMKYDFWDFSEKLSMNSKFGQNQNQAKMWDT